MGVLCVCGGVCVCMYMCVCGKGVGGMLICVFIEFRKVLYISVLKMLFLVCFKLSKMYR